MKESCESAASRARRSRRAHLVLALGFCLLVLSALMLVGCGEETAATPQGLAITDDRLTWEASAGAVYYRIRVDGEMEESERYTFEAALPQLPYTYESETPSLDLFERLAAPGRYELRVEAVGAGAVCSPLSEPIAYTVEPPTYLASRLMEDMSGLEITTVPGATVCGKVVIPSAIKGIPVKRIAGEAFSERTEVTAVVLPDTVIEIETSAFSGCTSLTRFRNSVCCETIAVAAFNRCERLERIDLPDSIGTIRGYAFAGCTALTEFSFPQMIGDIEVSTLEGCTALTSLTIPASVISIGERVVSGCSALISIAVEAGNPVYESAGNCVIRKADRALVLGINTSVIPDYVTSIEENAFRECAGLTAVTIPPSVTRIGRTAFYACTALTDLTLSSGLTEIGAYAFAQCSCLTTLEIPTTVTDIGEGIAGACVNLQSLTVAAGNAVYRSEGNCIIRRADDALVACGVTDTIPAGVRRLLPRSIVGLTCTHLTVSPGVEEIGEYAVCDCLLLRTMLVPRETSCAARIFDNCPLMRIIRYQPQE